MIRPCLYLNSYSCYADEAKTQWENIGMRVTQYTQVYKVLHYNRISNQGVPHTRGHIMVEALW